MYSYFNLYMCIQKVHILLNDSHFCKTIKYFAPTLHFVQVLLDRGLDENHRDNAGWGPLHYAAFEGHSIIVRLVGGAGAELDMLDCDGKSALHLACSEAHYDVVVQLLRAGASVNLVNLQVLTTC